MDPLALDAMKLLDGKFQRVAANSPKQRVRPNVWLDQQQRRSAVERNAK